MATNKPVFYRSITEILARAAEMGVGDGQFVSGCNRGVANGAIGINTGDFDPKESDFARNVKFAGPVSYIGKLESAIADFEDNMVGITGEQLPILDSSTRVGFDQAAADIAPDADYGTLPLTNYTGETIPEDSWAWGFEAVGGFIVAPIVDAGPDGDTFGSLTVSLDGTVVAGSDLTPDLLWTIVSGGTGTFTTPTAEDTSFTADSANFYTFALTATPDDGPPVVDTATWTVGIG